MPQHARMEWHGDAGAGRRGAVRGLRIAAEHILGQSRQEVPEEEGTLERSGVASVDEATLTAAVSYDTVYAVRQHEELTWRHDPSRKAKYLEDPMNSQSGTVGEIIAAEVRREIGS